MAVLKGAFHFEVHIGAGGNFGCKLDGQENEEAAVEGREAVL